MCTTAIWLIILGLFITIGGYGGSLKFEQGMLRIAGTGGLVMLVLGAIISGTSDC